MATNKKTENKRLVRCCDCLSSVRDTTGPSFNIESGVFFMGECSKGHADGNTITKPDGSVVGKVFMDDERPCDDFEGIFYAVGETFEHGGQRLVCSVPHIPAMRCVGCYFADITDECRPYSCASWQRRDYKNVNFQPID